MNIPPPLALAHDIVRSTASLRWGIGGSLLLRLRISNHSAHDCQLMSWPQSVSELLPVQFNRPERVKLLDGYLAGRCPGV